MATFNVVLADQLKGIQAELAEKRAKVEGLNARIAALESAEATLKPLVGEEPKVEVKKEGK